MASRSVAISWRRASINSRSACADPSSISPAASERSSGPIPPLTSASSAWAADSACVAAARRARTTMTASSSSSVWTPAEVSRPPIATCAVPRRRSTPSKASELERAADGLAREAEAMGEDAAAIDGERVRLLEEAKISAAVADLLEDVLDGLDEVTPQVGARPGLAQDVQGMNRDIAGFDDEVSTLLSDLSRPASPSASDAVRLLALDLKSARTSSKDLANLGAVIADEDEALEGVARRLGTAQVAIGGPLTSAGVQTADELDAVMVVLARRAARGPP